LRLLEFLAPVLRDSRLLVIGTYRDGDLGRGHPMAQTSAELARTPSVERIVLQGLSEAEVARVIENVTGAPSPADLVAGIHAETEGNPLFFTEFMRLLAEKGRIGGPGSQIRAGLGFRPTALGLPAVPPGVRDVIGLRLDRLSATCHRILTAAAVIGREFPLPVLKRVLGEEEQTMLFDALEEAEEARVIAALPATEHYRFHHALFREALYEGLPTTRRVRLHRHVAEAIEELWQTDPESRLAELAHHFVQAAPGGDVDKAIAYARRAAERAMQQLAYEEAVRLLQTALQLHDVEPSADPVQRCELLLALGEAQADAGDFPAGRETFLQAASLARSLGAGPVSAQAARLLARAIMLYTYWGQSGKGDHQAVPLLEEALHALGDSDPTLRARVLARLARAHFRNGERQAGAARSHAAVEVARRADDAAVLAAALEARHFATWTPDNVEERLADAAEIIRLAEAARDSHLAMVGHLWYFADLLDLGDIIAADQAFEVYSRLAEELRQPY
jgi:predicted ATPase